MQPGFGARRLLFYINYLFVLSFALPVTQLFAQSRQAAPVGLMCDLVEGTGAPIKSFQPAFSWMIPGATNQAVKQIAYQVIVSKKASTSYQGPNIAWNSGKVISGKSAAIRYGGTALQAGITYHWKVRVWTNAGALSNFSASAPFRMSHEVSAYATPTYPLVKTLQHPVKVTRNGTGSTADFGKDAFGQLSLTLFSEKGADKVTIHLGERIDSAGRINRKPGGSIRYSRYEITLKPGTHSYPVKLTPDARNTGPMAVKMPDSIGEVTPFRYVEVEGYPHQLLPEMLTRSMVHYRFNDQASNFKSSDTVLNQVWELSKYSIKATSFAGIYVDGDRERIPYEADALINQLSHYAVDREYSIARYSHEYLVSHANWPTEWIMQSVMMAWNDYLYTGDIRSSRKFYADLKAKTLLALQDSTGLISVQNQTEAIHKSIYYPGKQLKDIVDWPQTGTLGLGKSEAGETDGFVFKPYNAVTNAYFYTSLVLMSRLAEAMGEQDDSFFFRQKAEKLLIKYNDSFFNTATQNYRDGIGTDHSALHANFFALAFGLVNKNAVPSVVRYIQSRGMACSVYGSQFLLDALYDAGADDYALSLLTATSKRSWYNMIREGSTMTMEAWGDLYKPNQDWNHAWGAAPANIISRKLMGIEPVLPGWERFKIQPKPGPLSWGEIRVPTIKGTVSVQLRQETGKTFWMKVNIPGNTLADLSIPVNGEKAFTVRINGKLVKGQQKAGGVFLGPVGSGEHLIVLTYL